MVIMAIDDLDQETQDSGPSKRALVKDGCAESHAHNTPCVSNCVLTRIMDPLSIHISQDVANLQLDGASYPTSSDAAPTDQSRELSGLFHGPLAPTRDKSSQCNAPTSLDQLPAEILIKIAKFTDFTSLYALINTSRYLSNIFDHNTLAIVEYVLDWSSSIPEVIRPYMRAVFHLRTGAYRYKSLDYGRYSNKHNAYEVPLALYNSPGDRSLREATPALLRKFVTLVHQNHILAHDVIDQCLKNCDANDLAWSPSVTKPTTSLASTQGRLAAHIVPPSAKEERQAMLGVWMAQYFHEVKTAAQNKTLSGARWRPVSKNMVYLQTVDTALSEGFPLDFWDGYLGELVHTVHHVLTDTKSFSLPRPTGGLDQFHLGCAGTTGNTDSPSTRNLWSDIPIPNSGYREWQNTFDRFHDPWWEYNANSNFRAFRGFGFAFWDKSRMKAYGLTKPSRGGRRRVDPDENKANYERWERLAQWDKTWYDSLRRQFGARN